MALGLEAAEFEPYGRDKAKVDLSVLERLTAVPDGRAGRGHRGHADEVRRGQDDNRDLTTQGLGCIGERSLVCLREPSVGPTLGAKGDGTGGGLAQVVPAEDINLHFTGDLHAIAAANNRLASAVDAHLVHGNELGIARDDHAGAGVSTSKTACCAGSTRRARSHANAASTSRPRQR